MQAIKHNRNLYDQGVFFLFKAVNLRRVVFFLLQAVNLRQSENTACLLMP